MENKINMCLSRLYTAKRARDNAKDDKRHEKAKQQQEYMDAHKASVVQLIYNYGMVELKQPDVRDEP